MTPSLRAYAQKANGVLVVAPGAPGVGKEKTHEVALRHVRGLTRLVCSQILVEEYGLFDESSLLPDDKVWTAVRKVLLSVFQPETANRPIIFSDGFPRTKSQAGLVTAFARERHLLVITLDLVSPREVCLERMLSRGRKGEVTPEACGKRFDELSQRARATIKHLRNNSDICAYVGVNSNLHPAQVGKQVFDGLRRIDPIAGLVPPDRVLDFAV